MVAMNIAKTGKSNAVAGVILFGIGLAVLQFVLTSNMQHPSSTVMIIFGIAGAYCMNYLFWRPYIGFSTFYRARPIWVPLTIAVILAVIVILGVMNGAVYNK